MRDKNPQVYIAPITRSTDMRDIEDKFGKFGSIRDIQIKRGYGFIEFENHRDADDAVYEMNGVKFKGQRLTVEPAGMKRRKTRGPQPDDVCFNCRGKGHWANDCRERMRGGGGGGRDRSISSDRGRGGRGSGGGGPRGRDRSRSYERSHHHHHHHNHRHHSRRHDSRSDSRDYRDIKHKNRRDISESPPHHHHREKHRDDSTSHRPAHKKVPTSPPSDRHGATPDQPHRRYQSQSPRSDSRGRGGAAASHENSQYGDRS